MNGGSGPPATSPAVSGHATFVSTDPPIIVTPFQPDHRFILAFGQRFPNREIIFLLMSVWHCNEACAAKKAEAARRFSALLPMHRLIHLGNTEKETELLADAGLESFSMNHNTFVPENVFYPLPGTAIEVDAVYNARPLPEKRHDLAAEIERIAYVCGVTQEGERPETRGIVDAILARPPGHRIINPLRDGLPRWMSQSDVNATLARAAVGLCLSEVEGAMFSSIEYLAAGLPIVTIPNQGGRDYFFDADYCITAEANPRAVREAVEALRDRGIPRDHVRARTLARLKPERDRFLAFLDELRAQRGTRGRHEHEPWPYSGENIRRWGSVDEHARAFLPVGTS